MFCRRCMLHKIASLKPHGGSDAFVLLQWVEAASHIERSRWKNEAALVWCKLLSTCRGAKLEDFLNKGGLAQRCFAEPQVRVDIVAMLLWRLR